MPPNPDFVYRTYIRTTPERLWKALTEPSFTERYWGITLDSDWRVGSTIAMHDKGVTIADGEQVVLEAEPYHRLAYTWHTFTPEWAAVHEISNELLATIAAEPRSKVTFDIEDLGEMCKLTVIHDGFEPGSTVLEMISGGWPRLISDIKTLLETGETLPAESESVAAAGRPRR